MDIERPSELIAYLRECHHITADEQPRVTVLAGGVSNRTVLLERAGGRAWVFKQALAKLRVAADWFSSPERIHREALGLRWLGELLPPGSTPRLVLEDHENHLLAMEAVPQPHENWKTMLMRGDVRRETVEQFGLLLHAIHHQAAARREELEPVFRDTSFFESLRLEPYYAYTADRTPQAAAFLRALIADTRAVRATLAHGDYSPKNILVRDDGIVLLDHEVIHWGDPSFDIGFSLALILSKAHHLQGCRANFMDAAHLYWKSYADSSHERRAVRHTLACLLARVDGRSPVEYLDDHERPRQRAAALKQMADTPGTIDELIERFASCL